eukprot:TRINITY_DN6806_c0_g2_i2.p1 TRINITY_DN6806_c0_g2~~TRINITY_DN6806_c0_g2_i2.p1  ORF type:complete len:297 (-),score=102.01 TRINITY_DN6806_c0_g2_i2:143-1033(-)
MCSVPLLSSILYFLVLFFLPPLSTSVSFPLSGFSLCFCCRRSFFFQNPGDRSSGLPLKRCELEMEGNNKNARRRIATQIKRKQKQIIEAIEIIKEVLKDVLKRIEKLERTEEREQSKDEDGSNKLSEEEETIEFPDYAEVMDEWMEENGYNTTLSDIPEEEWPGYIPPYGVVMDMYEEEKRKERERKEEKYMKEEEKKEKAEEKKGEEETEGEEEKEEKKKKCEEEERSLEEEVVGDKTGEEGKIVKDEEGNKVSADVGRWFENYPFSKILPGPWAKEFVERLMEVMEKDSKNPPF